MGIFDLVLILSVLLSFVTLLAVGVIAATGRVRLAARMLGVWGLCVAFYLTIVVIVSIFTKPRDLAIGEDACFDDWCIAVDHVEHAPTSGPRTYIVTFRLSSRARRVSQREHNLIAYLRDADGRRYEAGPASNELPFDTLLTPGQTLQTTRVYGLPPGTEQPQLVIKHEGGFPIGWFIIGEGPFAKGIQVAMR
jgi:hypothetical protein